jgi:lysozyme
LAATGCSAGATSPIAFKEQGLCTTDPGLEGVDVSYWRETVDWGSAASGKAFAIAKATDGSYTDSTFVANWPGMKAAGLVRGAFHFFEGSVDGVSQANNFLSYVNANGGFQTGDLPPAIDVEEYSLTSDHATDYSRFVTTVQTIEAAIGRHPIIYTNYNTWHYLFGDPNTFQSYPAWIAGYGTCATYLPSGLPNIKIWQYTSSGTDPGIKPPVDLDKFLGSLDDLHAFAGGVSGRTTCDNNVPINSTACSKDDNAAEYVCVDPNQSSSQQWSRRPCPAGQTCVGTHCQGATVPPCGNGLWCAWNALPGSSQCMSGSSSIYCCPAGQTIVNDACAGRTTCDNGVAIGSTACSQTDPSGEYVCVDPNQSSSQQWSRVACPEGQTCVGTQCQGSIPACGNGLWCTWNAIAGSSECNNGSQNIYCCAFGHTIVNNVCN